ncbi:MAG: sugar transferase [bacterium]
MGLLTNYLERSSQRTRMRALRFVRENWPPKPVKKKPAQLAMKRGLDLAVGLAGVAVFAPTWPVIAIAIKLDSPGPILFHQRRNGLNGRPHIMTKFRSMRVGATIATGPEASGIGLGDITRVGKFMRRRGLDETLQFVSILRGDMSAVGPRPRPFELFPELGTDPLSSELIRVKPGLTGLTQVCGRNQIEMGPSLRDTLDHYYANTWTIWTDIKILLKTPLVVVTGHGA